MAGDNEPKPIPAPEPTGGYHQHRREGDNPLRTVMDQARGKKMDPLTLILTLVVSVFMGGGGFASYKELAAKLDAVMTQQTDNAKALARVEAYMTVDAVTKAEMKAEIIRQDRELRDLAKTVADHDARIKALERTPK